MHRRHLVAADVDVAGARRFDHLGPDLMDELQGLRGEVEDVVEDRRVVGHPVQAARVGGKLRIGGQHRGGVTGEINLGDGLDAPLPGILSDRGDLLQGVVAAVRGAVVTPHPVRGLGPPAGFLGQQRIAVRRDPPALVVSQVPVEDVELVPGHPVDEVKHLGDLQEVP